MAKLTICPHCGGKYEYYSRNKAGRCDVYCNMVVPEGKWLETEEPEKRDLKQEMKEFIELHTLNFLSACDCEHCTFTKDKLWQWITENFTPKS